MKKIIILALIILIFAGGNLFAVDFEDTIGFMGNQFDKIYELFRDQLNLSFLNLQKNVIPMLLGWLLLLELVWVATQAILQKKMSVPELFMKFFLCCLIIIIVQNLDTIVEGLTSIFTNMAYQASTSGNLYKGGLTDGEFALFKPSAVSETAKDMFKSLEEIRYQITKYADDIMKAGTTIKKSLEAFFLVLPALGAKLLCFIVQILLLVVLAFANLNILMWLIEFNFLLVVCCICLPWHIFSPTKFLASGVWQALFGQAIKLFCVVFMVAISGELFQRVAEVSIVDMSKSLADALANNDAFPLNTVLSVCLLTIVMVISYCYFLLKGPAIAKAIIVGQPTMETLGTHAVTKMGAKGIGAVLGGGKALGGLAARGTGRAFGGIRNAISKGMNKQSSGGGSSAGVNNNKLD